MEKELEITVEITCSYEQLDDLLTEKGFKVKEKYTVKDKYLMENSLDISNLKPLDILSKCIIVREVEGFEKELLYKYKKYDENENIIEQGKVRCPVIDIDKAINFMEKINYKILFEINDNCTVYSNGDIEVIVQDLGENNIYMEMESKPNFIDKEFTSIEEMKEVLNKYDLPFNKDNYFVKKAEIILKEILLN